MRHKRFICLSAILILCIIIPLDLVWTGYISHILDLPTRRRITRRIRCVQMLYEIDMKLKIVQSRHDIIRPDFRGITQRELMPSLSRFCAAVDHEPLIGKKRCHDTWLKYENRSGEDLLIDPWGNTLHVYRSDDPLIIDKNQLRKCSELSDVVVWSSGPNGVNDWGGNDDIVMNLW